MGERRAMAIAAHPDDIEFMMAGTLLALKAAGWQIHYFNLSSGNLGSMTLGPARIAAVRRREARSAARTLGATWHPPIARDLEIFYNDRLLRKVCAVVRDVAPRIVLTHSPQDYMEDHSNTSRLAVTAMFARGFRNYQTSPPVAAVSGDATVYHAMPHLLRDPLGRPVQAECFVDVGPFMEGKRAALSAHRSQKEWLDATQGLDSYLQAMADMAAEVGRASGRFEFAEGWRRHFHAGFCARDDDPLREALGARCVRNKAYDAG